MRRVSAKNTSVNQQHLVKYTQRVYIIVPVNRNCAIYYYFVKKGQWAWGMGHGKNAIRYRTRIKNSASLIPDAHCPMRDARCPLPNAHFLAINPLYNKDSNVGE
ncbi:MAG: hypothetical protein ICV78_15245 [Tolypothrix sp. Co-bin9]|nr:hypothetical protein [Tolypothrix sp. Co-bin9]